MPSKLDWVEKKFPNICKNYRHKDGPAGYNCVAFAADDTLRWWWPANELGYYWPPNVPVQEDLPSFIACFKSLNYEECGLNEFLENGFEKVAIYVDGNNIPKHVAKQFVYDNGYWRSKLADADCISHTLGGLSGLFNGMQYANYGNVAIILRRKANVIQTQPASLAKTM